MRRALHLPDAPARPGKRHEHNCGPSGRPRSSLDCLLQRLSTSLDLEQAVADGRIRNPALESLEPEYIEAIERETFNVNTPDDLARAEEILRDT